MGETLCDQKFLVSSQTLEYHHTLLKLKTEWTFKFGMDLFEPVMSQMKKEKNILINSKMLYYTKDIYLYTYPYRILSIPRSLNRRFHSRHFHHLFYLVGIPGGRRTLGRLVAKTGSMMWDL